MGSKIALDATRAFWQTRTSRALSLEDAREITENMTGFFSILARWAADQDRAAEVQQEGEEKHAA